MTTPIGACMGWQPAQAWLHAGADLAIAGALLAILAVLLVIPRRRPDLATGPVVVLIAAFIVACAATHLLGALADYTPGCRFEGTAKAATAVLCLAAAAALWRHLPAALALPSLAALQQSNAALAREVARHTERAAGLADSEHRLQRIYAHTPAALHATDAHGIVIDVSDRWLDLAGHERDAVIGRPIAEFYDPASAAESVDHFEALHAGSNLLTCERRLLRADGSLRHIELTLEVERDAGGGLLRVLAAVSDITPRKAAETALAAAEERLRQAQKMEAVGQLTGGIAHDFNNLLTAILGSLELLTSRGSLDARAQRLADNAQEAARRAARLVSQLLSFSRRQMLCPEPLDPAAVIDGIRDLLAQTLGRRIALDTPAATGGWRAMADRNQVEAALLNLVINARDAIIGDGVVRIDVGEATLSRASLAQGSYLFDESHPPGPGDYVRIAVTDTGTGMDAGVKARAFEPFFTTKPQGSGTGLGLSQLYGFISQSGGAVLLQSAPGEGTRIEMLRPRAT